MKKLFLLAAAALTVFAACTKNEVTPTPDQKITFSSPVVGSATKTERAPMPGEMNTTTKYFTNEHFSVFALHHTDAYQSWDKGTVYMNDVDCAYSAADNSWLPELGDGGLAYYWPKDPTSYLTFAAYTPTDVKKYIAQGESITYDEDGLTVPSLTLPTNDAKQYDFMYSERTFNKNESTGGTDYEGVDINFKHALSQIAFTVASDKDYTNDMTIKVQNITVKNVVKTGTFSENITDGVVYQSVPAWDLEDTNTYDHQVSMVETTVTTTSNSALVNTNNIILLPQPVQGLEIVVNYTIQHKAADSPVIAQVATLPIEQTGDTEDKDNWLMGKKYIYNITIGFDKVMFSPEVVDWTVVNNANTGLTI